MKTVAVRVYEKQGLEQKNPQNTYYYPKFRNKLRFFSVFLKLL
jgi:hypothetical protein